MFLEKNGKLWASILVGLTAVINSISYFLLPDKIVMQIRYDGSAGTTLPTWIGLVVSLVLIVMTTIKMTSDQTGKGKMKWFILSVFLIVINIMVIVLNLIQQ